MGNKCVILVSISLDTFKRKMHHTLIYEKYLNRVMNLTFEIAFLARPTINKYINYQ